MHQAIFAKARLDKDEPSFEPEKVTYEKAEKGATTQEREMDNFQKGQEVSIRRSSGIIEGGWEIYEIDKEAGEVAVHKKGGPDVPEGQVLIKRITIKELKEVNRKI